jgi:hypothetical protein
VTLRRDATGWRGEPAEVLFELRARQLGPAAGVAVNGDQAVTIALTDTQVARLVREASGGTGLVALLSGVGELEEMRRVMLPLLGEVGCSGSVIRGLLVLGAFPVDSGERDLAGIARATGFSPSITHRYTSTWVALGLLEQDPRSRRYHRALADAQAASARQPMSGRGGDAS